MAQFFGFKISSDISAQCASKACFACITQSLAPDAASPATCSRHSLLLPALVLSPPHSRVHTQKQNDDAFNQKAVDALLNFETVKYFCAEQHISDVYDQSLIAVADASIASQTSLSVLNVGQNLIISAGVALAMLLAGQQAARGRMSVGDFVLVNVYILQLYAPLNFLGTYYRMIKQSLVDVESMFALLKEGREVDVRRPGVDLRLRSLGILPHAACRESHVGAACIWCNRRMQRDTMGLSRSV